MRTVYCSRCLTSFTGDPSRCPNLGCGAGRPSAGWDGLLGPGDVLDRHYRVQQVLALAGGGVTYRARALDALDADTGPDLAIKVLYAQRVSGEHLLRLANEAQLLRHLAHPNIVECLGFAHRDGAPPYLVTRFEHGGTLAEHVERVGPLRPDVAASVTLQIVGALQQAHALGIVHRDMKPQNVLLRAPCARDEVPVVRVADFGIAKVRGGLGDGRTRAGAFVGTPEYAAPEQFEGLAPTAAADVYAVGALFFVLLTGRAAFRPADRNDPMASLSELRASLPPCLPRVSADSEAWRACQDVMDLTMRVDPDARADTHALSELLARVVRSGAVDAAAGVSGLSESATLAPSGTMADGWRASGAGAGGRSLTFVPDTPPSPPSGGLPAAAAVVAAPRGGASPIRPPRAGDLSLDALVAGYAPPEGTLDAEWSTPSVSPFAGGVVPPAPRAPSAARPPFPRAVDAPEAPGGAGVDALLAELGGLPDDAVDAHRALAARILADPRALTQALGSLRADAARSVGFCRLAVLEGRADWTSRVRALLADPSPLVRAAACDALGAIGTAQGLSALPGLAQDASVEVRAACARGLVWITVRHGRADLSRPPLERLARDADAKVRAQAVAALDLLDRAAR